jgi:diguanylate cyclase (GGDEF)-like protein
MFSQLKESGIVSTWGKAKLVSLALEFYIIFMLVVSKSESSIKLLNMRIPILHNFGLTISEIPFFVYLIITAAVIIKIARAKSSYDTRILIVLLTMFISLQMVEDKISLSIFSSAAGLILTLGILEASYSMAYLDELTGIPSRRALKEDLLKLSNKYVIAMIDIDFFKKFNDTYGHDVGDEVLKIVAKSLERVGEGGKAYRFGGEEFTIIFPGKAMSNVIPELEKLREQISKTGLAKHSTAGKTTVSEKSMPRKTLHVTISIGVSERSTNNKTTQEVLSAADKALYRAKNKGRNCEPPSWDI